MQSLVIFAHPALEKSRVNRELVKAAKGVGGVQFHDLYEEYPDFQIDIEREKQLLLDHELIIFHHPFYWYSCPALLKEWIDVVLQYGFAYGGGADALRGKTLWSVITTGGGESAYTKDGYNNHEIKEFMVPFEQTAQLCGMNYKPPLVFFGSIDVKKDQIKRWREEYQSALEEVTKDG